MPRKRPPGKPVQPRHPPAPVPTEVEIAERAAAIRAEWGAMRLKPRDAHARNRKWADTLSERYEPRVHHARLGRDEREE